MRSTAGWVQGGMIRQTRFGADGPLEGKLVFAEKLFPVLIEADQHHHC
jgi:hypothetical protein